MNEEENVYGNESDKDAAQSTKPDHITYNYLIKAYANTGNLSKAECILRWITQQSDKKSCENDMSVSLNRTKLNERI